MKNTTLLIMAAGIGSRFGTGIKQLEPVGLHNEIIMDYSIHDAIEAGFNKIIFVIRKDIEADFRERIGNRGRKALGVSHEKLGIKRRKAKLKFAKNFIKSTEVYPLRASL